MEANIHGPLEIVDVVLIGGTGEMGQIFCFALLRHRVWHGALRIRLRSHVRSAVKTASWRVFAAVLVAILLMDLMFRKRSSGTGDGLELGGLDFGGGDGDGCGD